jgi:hypothetical protein
VAHIEDLAPCTYLCPAKWADRVLAIGWLERGKPYPKGEIGNDFARKLVELGREPWQPFVAGGWHTCEFCRVSEWRDGANLFIPGEGVLYAAPRMVIHYVDVHEYQPPDAFSAAVLNCPPMRSLEYLRALRAAMPTGLLIEWRSHGVQFPD